MSLRPWPVGSVHLPVHSVRTCSLVSVAKSLAVGGEKFPHILVIRGKVSILRLKLGKPSNLLNWNLYFNRIPRWFVSLSRILTHWMVLLQVGMGVRVGKGSSFYATLDLHSIQLSPIEGMSLDWSKAIVVQFPTINREKKKSMACERWCWHRFEWLDFISSV
jgi:hypothetical protein